MRPHVFLNAKGQLAYAAAGFRRFFLPAHKPKSHSTPVTGRHSSHPPPPPNRPPAVPKPLVLALLALQTPLKVSLRTVQRMIKRGDLEAIRVSGVWRIPEKALQDLLASGTGNPIPPERILFASAVPLSHPDHGTDACLDGLGQVWQGGRDFAQFRLQGLPEAYRFPGLFAVVFARSGGLCRPCSHGLQRGRVHTMCTLFVQNPVSDLLGRCIVSVCRCVVRLVVTC